MDWTNFIGPAVVAAGVSAVVAIIGTVISYRLALRVHGEKLAHEAAQLERRVTADLDLAERRFQFDKDLVTAKRRGEIAEEVLADFYQVEKAFQQIRSRMIWSEEMLPEEGVEDAVIRDGGYGVIRRLRSFSDLFSSLEARRFRAEAMLGRDLGEAYLEVVRVHNQVFFAAKEILAYRDGVRTAHMDEFIQDQRRIAFDVPAGEDDPIRDRIAAAVGLVEGIARRAM